MNKPAKYILNTFDYELFLGAKSGVIQECLIEPTNKLLQVLKRFNLQGIFFIDTMYLLQLKNNSAVSAIKKDYDCIYAQLQELVKQGHLIFPHIHPHWMDAKYLPDTNQWNLSDSNKYKLSDLPTIDQNSCFQDSISLLMEILQSAESDQIINCYRAGGWSLQPFSTFKEHFINHQIKYDFSVLPGIYQFSRAQSFDYSNCTQKLPYKFSIEADENLNEGEFFEFPISIIEHSSLTEYLHKVQVKVHSKIYKDSSHNRGIGQTSQPIQNKPKNYTGKQLSNSVEYLSLDFLSKAKEYAYNKYVSNHDYVHFLSHPKLLTRHAINSFQNILDLVSSKFSLESNYIQIQNHFTP